MTHLAIIIPFYNGNTFLNLCLDSILSEVSVEFTIYIVDNNIYSFNKGLNFPRHDKIEIIRTQPSIGFGRACNIGAYNAIKAGHEYLLILNQDTILSPSTLTQFCKYTQQDNSELVVYTPMLFEYDFNQPSMMVLKKYVSHSEAYLKDSYNGTIKEKYELPTIGAACIFMHKRVIEKIGLFDPVFYHYGEDYDFFNRLRTHGGKLYLLPKIKVAHFAAHNDKDEKRSKQRNYHYLKAQVIKKLRYHSIKHTTKYIISTMMQLLMIGHWKSGFLFGIDSIVILSNFRQIRNQEIEAVKKRMNEYIQKDSKLQVTNAE